MSLRRTSSESHSHNVSNTFVILGLIIAIGGGYMFVTPGYDQLFSGIVAASGLSVILAAIVGRRKGSYYRENQTMTTNLFQ